MKDSDARSHVILLAMMLLAMAIMLRVLNTKPAVTPCDGQLVNGAIAAVEFRYCIHPVVAR